MTGATLGLWACSVMPLSAGGGWALPLTVGLALLLTLLAWSDLRTGLLPDRLTLTLLASGAAATALLDGARPLDHVLGALAGYGVLRLLAGLYRRVRGHDGLGQGDAKLLAGLGAWTGWQALPGLLFLAAAGGLAALLLARMRGSRPDWRAPLPFGPFLAGAGWLAWLYGPLLAG
ncbi:prepilin peptidase [Oleisolibacter albus]|uniref:prepilin peptidase n=1 Tax=Oleisolibacter albus TaxID=2171757 RepID=UPI00138FC3BC|nr:A24 family peptidase [Oleisolibacter albus]